MPHGCLHQSKDDLYVIVITHSWSSIPCSTHYPLALQTLGIQNHMVWGTNNERTKRGACILSPRELNINHKPHAHTQPINCNFVPQKDTMIPYMAETHHPLDNQVLAIFPPSATIPSTTHYSKCHRLRSFFYIFYNLVHIFSY